MADDGLEGLGRRSALGLVGAAVSGVATIGTLVVASRALDTTETGQFFVALAVFAIAEGLCSLGIDAGLQFWIPAVDEPSGRHLVRRGLLTVSMMGVGAGALVWLLAGPLASVVSDGDGTGTRTVLRATALLIPFAGLLEVAFGAMRALDHIVSATVIDRVVRPIAQVVAMAMVAVAGGGAVAMTYAWMLPVALSVVVAAGLAARPQPTSRRERTRPPIAEGAFWRYTAPRAVARSAQVLTQRLDVILLAAIGSVEAAGVYGTVSRCMIAGVFVATAVQQLVQPRLRALVVRGDLGAVKQMYGASTTWLVIATWPGYLTMAIFASTVLRVFGDDATTGSTALTILCLAMLVASACGLVEVVLLMLGRSWLSTVNILAALAVNVVLNVALIPVLGMNGAALAWAASILMTNLMPLYQVSRAGLHPGGVPLATATITSVATVGLSLAIGRVLGGESAVVLLVSLTVGLVAYAVALFVLRRQVLLDRFVRDLRPKRTQLETT